MSGPGNGGWAPLCERMTRTREDPSPCSCPLSSFFGRLELADSSSWPVRTGRLPSLGCLADPPGRSRCFCAVLQQGTQPRPARTSLEGVMTNGTTPGTGWWSAEGSFCREPWVLTRAVREGGFRRAGSGRDTKRARRREEKTLGTLGTAAVFPCAKSRYSPSAARRATSKLSRHWLRRDRAELATGPPARAASGLHGQGRARGSPAARRRKLKSGVRAWVAGARLI